MGCDADLCKNSTNLRCPFKFQTRVRLKELQIDELLVKLVAYDRKKFQAEAPLKLFLHKPPKSFRHQRPSVRVLYL